jgi:hypothetical protein
MNVKPNATELRRVLAHVEANQDQWEQDNYRVDLADFDDGRCGTAYCFAGWKAQLDGVKWKYPLHDFFPDVIALPDGSEASADAYAAQALGIEHTRDCGEIPLFEAHNTLDDLRRIVAELCAEAES